MKGYNEYEENEEYKEITNLLEKASGLESDSVFKAQARARLLKMIANEPQPAKVVRIRPRRLVIRTMAAVAALSLLMTGVGFASSDSLPGDTLYPVKRGIEEARLRATRNDESKANLYLKIADRRLAESEKLKSLNRKDRIEATLKLMSGNFDQAQALMNRVPAARRVIILKRLAARRAQAEIRKQRILDKRQEQLNKRQQQQSGQPEKQNLKPETKLKHFKNSNEGQKPENGNGNNKNK